MNISATPWAFADRGSCGSIPRDNSVDTRAIARISGVSSLTSAGDASSIFVPAWPVLDRGSNGSTRFVGDADGSAGVGNGGYMTSHSHVLAISSMVAPILFRPIGLS
jgi:hypothetical protein